MYMVCGRLPLEQYSSTFWSSFGVADSALGALLVASMAISPPGFGFGGKGMDA